MTRGFAFDVQAVCSGFVYALNVADGLLRVGQGKRALVIGAEVFSKILDWEDRGTCVLFGDGAGAVVLESQERCRIRCGSPASSARCFSPMDGTGTSSMWTEALAPRKPWGISACKARRSSASRSMLLPMSSKKPFTRITLRRGISIGSSLIRRTSASSTEPRKKLASRREKIVVTLDRHGNTSAASIPLALVTAVRDGRIKKGDLILLEAMGGGFTWGANLLRW